MVCGIQDKNVKKEHRILLQGAALIELFDLECGQKIQNYLND